MLISRENLVLSDQWVDWKYMEEKKDPIFDQVIVACERQKIKRIMSYQHDWNVELIAQFYAIVYFHNSNGEESRWEMVWMTEGTVYSISYMEFAHLIGKHDPDFNRPKIHLEQCLPDSEMKFMYPPQNQGYCGQATGLYTFYASLYRMFRKTLNPRGGDATNISNYAKNLLAGMRENARPFCLTKFKWEEIKDISYDQYRSCAYPPIIMRVIERSTWTDFVKIVPHKPLRIRLSSILSCLLLQLLLQA
ncbi:hypothetical protein BS78_K235300 [Paspalum vaginatum]|uniref:Uncharacterized protein n=1 Tax=Paspalum vaginatum TaxID=158149 RepID=A0A9W7X829_9POAL|nr:hypothetical protein BS78_K235300 [Paspalum vaginatum]